MHKFSIKLGSALVFVLFLFTSAAGAADHTLLTPLLVDLSDWTAEPAGGMTVDMGTSKMINATREYRQGDRQLNAMVMVGNQAMTQGSMQAMTAETGEGKMSVRTIDGFNVQTFHDKKENSGGVMVQLGQSQQQGAMFTLIYKGLSEEQGLEAAKKFNWKEMKSSVAKLF